MIKETRVLTALAISSPLWWMATPCEINNVSIQLNEAATPRYPDAPQTMKPPMPQKPKPRPPKPPAPPPAEPLPPAA